LPFKTLLYVFYHYTLKAAHFQEKHQKNAHWFYIKYLLQQLTILVSGIIISVVKIGGLFIFFVRRTDK